MQQPRAESPVQAGRETEQAGAAGRRRSAQLRQEGALAAAQP